MSTKHNIYGSLFVSNNISGDTLSLSTISGDTLSLSTLNNNDSLTEILARNSSGLIEYRDVQSIISAATSEDTFITGFTYNDSNTFVISDNSGSTFSATINNVTGLTSVGDINIIGNLVVTGGTGNVITKQIYVEGNLGLDWDFSSSSVVLGNISDGTIINGSSLIVNSDTLVNGSITGNSLNLSSTTNDNSLTQILGRNSTTGDVEYRDVSSIIGAASADTYVISGNADVATSQLSFTYNTGGTFNVTNSAALFSDNDINVTGGTYNPSTGCVTFSTNSGTTFDVCGFVTGITDSYTTGSTLVGESIQFDNNILGSNYYSVSLTPALSGKNDVSTFESYTANTKVEIDSKLNISTFNNYTANTTDFFLTGGTYSSGTATFENNNGDSFDVSGFTEPFTGNTSGDCIDEFWVKNISGCTSEDLHIGVQSGKDIYFDSTGTTDSPSLYINSRGQIGVGTNTPFSWATTDGTGIEIHNDSINNQIPFAVTETGTRRFFIETDFATTSNPVHIKGSSSTNLMTFYTSSSSSRVGIGTTIPEGSLQIAKSGTVSDQTKYPSETNVVINNTSNGYSGSTGAANSAAFRFDHETSEIPGGLITSKRRDTWASGEKSTSFEIWNNSGETLIKRFEILPDGKTTIIGSLNIDTILSGTPVINLGIDSSGNVVTGITSLEDVTRVQPGVNINTGGTANNPIVNLDDDILLNSVSGNTLSGGTIYSGSTDLYDIFLTTAGGNDITRVQGGTNISTGGTANNPIVNLDDDILLNSVSGNTLSGGTIYSGSTDLYDIFLTENVIWKTGSTGNFSLKTINDSGLDATGNYALAEGRGTIASGASSHAEGRETVAGGPRSHAEGWGTTALGEEAHAEGYETTASGEDSHSEGLFTIASGDYSHAEGWSTTASGEDSHSEGFGTVASGADSHAEGLSNTASNIASHAEGFNTISTSIASHSEGFDTLASADAAHSEGYSSTASGLASHSEGFETTSSGSFSHAGGSSSIASGDTSFVHSTNSLVTGSRSVVLGGQNITGTTDDTVYVPYLSINSLASGTSVNNLGIDIDGNVVTGSTDENDITRVSGGINISTGGTANNPIVNLDDDISLSSVSATTLSGGTIYSGSTDLSDIFLTTADGNDITRVSSGINTFTGGTGNNPTVNITGLTVDNISVSGVSSFQSVSATTYFGDGSNLSGITDFYLTGQTFDDSNYILTSSLNNGSVLNTDLSVLASDIFVVSGVYSSSTGIVTYTNSSGGTFNVSGFTTGMTDSYTNAANLNGNVIEFNNNIQGSNFYNVDLSPALSAFTTGNTYVTGFTYDNANTFTISRNDGMDISASINTLTGLTIDGILSATTYAGLTLNDLDDVTTGIPVTPDNSYQGRQIYFDVASNEFVSTQEYGALGTVTIWGKKGSAGTIDKGCPVYITGFDDDIHQVELANATSATTMPVVGFTGEDFDNTTTNPIITFGKITGLDTTTGSTILNPFGETWEVNDVLYMAKADGGLTKNRPTGTNTQIQRVAKILKVDSNSGQLFIFNTARTAGLPNLTTHYLWVGNGDDTPQEVLKTDVGITTTGFTYNNNNTFTITDDNGGSFSSTINQVSGLTINGDLDVTVDTTLNALTATTITSNSAINVFNGHINLRDNSYFLQGRTVADVNVSLIGVDNQDRVFVGNAGYDTYINSDTIVDGVLSAQTVFLTTTPTLNNSATDILVRNNITGEVEYRPVSGITPDTNTFVVGGTYIDSTNTIALLRNDGNFVNVTGVTNTYVTGGTVSIPATNNSNNGTIGLFYKDSDGIPRTLPFEDTYTSGTTFASNQATLTRNDGTEVFKLTGGTNVVLSNPSANQIKLGLDLGIKSGTVRGVDFTGTPLTLKVTFTTPYPDSDYSVSITGSVNRNFTFQSKTAASFIINANSSTSFSDDVDWSTIKYGEQ